MLSVGEADHHRAAARAQEVDREPARALLADRVEHEVGAAGHRLGRAERRVRAERLGGGAARGVDVEHAGPARAADQRRLQRHQPDRPGAEHDDAVGRPGLDARAPDARRVHAVGERLGERAEPRVGAVGQLAQAVDRHGHGGGEAAGAVHADQLAAVGELLDALEHGAAGDQRVDRDAAPAPALLDARRRRSTTRPANSWPMTSGGVRLAWWPR